MQKTKAGLNVGSPWIRKKISWPRILGNRVSQVRIKPTRMELQRLRNTFDTEHLAPKIQGTSSLAPQCSAFPCSSQTISGPFAFHFTHFPKNWKLTWLVIQNPMTIHRTLAKLRKQTEIQKSNWIQFPPEKKRSVKFCFQSGKVIVHCLCKLSTRSTSPQSAVPGTNHQFVRPSPPPPR